MRYPSDQATPHARCACRNGTGAPSFDALDTSEADVVCRFAASRKADWVVVDHYGADEAYLKAVAADRGLQCCVFDDHQVRPADLRLAPMQPEAPKSLCGVQYLLLKPEFEAGAKKALPRGSAVRSGLVLSFGGADTFGGTAQVIEALTAALAKSTQPAPRITVLASDKMAEAQGLDGLLHGWPGGAAKRVAWLEACDVAQLFGTCEHAIVSCSGTAVEALAMGAAVVAWHSVENQDNHAKAIAERGIPVATTPQACAEAFLANRLRACEGLTLTLTLILVLTLTLIGRLRACEGIDAQGAWRVATALGEGTGKASN